MVRQRCVGAGIRSQNQSRKLRDSRGEKVRSGEREQLTACCNPANPMRVPKQTARRGPSILIILLFNFPTATLKVHGRYAVVDRRSVLYRFNF
jgi:hypothetical protein